MDLTLYDMAKLIPEKYRLQILDGNLVYKAVAQPGDPHMRALFVIWQNYIDPSGIGLDMTCSTCLSRMLSDYQELLPSLVQLQKESSLLDGI